MHQPQSGSIESRTSWTVASVSLFAMLMAYGAPWITIVALSDIAAEAGGARSVPSLASSLAWYGAGIGGIIMGRVADRIGTRWTVLNGALMIGVGLWLSSFGPNWPLWIGHGLFIGLLGLGGINAPLYVYVSRWFDRRRGSAMALISSGSYLAGAMWPTLFERAIAWMGWRQTMLSYLFVEIVVIVPLALLYLRPPPEVIHPATAPASGARREPVLGLPPNWYKDPAYRSRIVREPRATLGEAFDLDIPDTVEIRVWDSSSEMRYWVLPQRPAGTEGLDEKALAALVTREAMIGTGTVGAP